MGNGWAFGDRDGVLTQKEAEAFGAGIAETLRSDGGEPDLDFFVQTPADPGCSLLELDADQIGPGLFRRRADGRWQYEREATAEERAMWRWAIYLWDRI